jgi:hypothetical protein
LGSLARSAHLAPPPHTLAAPQTDILAGAGTSEGASCFPGCLPARGHTRRRHRRLLEPLHRTWATSAPLGVFKHSVPSGNEDRRCLALLS